MFHLQYLCHYLKAMGDWVEPRVWKEVPVGRTAWAFLRDSYFGDVCLKYQPDHFAIAILYFAILSHGVEVPGNRHAKTKWWEVRGFFFTVSILLYVFVSFFFPPYMSLCLPLLSLFLSLSFILSLTLACGWMGALMWFATSFLRSFYSFFSLFLFHILTLLTLSFSSPEITDFVHGVKGSTRSFTIPLPLFQSGGWMGALVRLTPSFLSHLYPYFFYLYCMFYSLCIDWTNLRSTWSMEYIHLLILLLFLLILLPLLPLSPSLYLTMWIE